MKEEKRGRPLSTQKSVGRIIVDYLREHGRATYSELAEKARGTDRIAHRVLNNALKQLRDKKLIEKHPEMRGEKVIVYYTLTFPSSAMVSGREAKSYHEWIHETAWRLEEMGTMSPELLEKTRGKPWVDSGGLVADQVNALRTAAKWLGVIILGIIGEANAGQDEEARRRSLDRACCDYLPGFINEAARLASPTLGDPRAAVVAAITEMGGEDFFFRTMWQIPAHVDRDEGSSVDVVKYREYAKSRDGSHPGI